MLLCKITTYCNDVAYAHTKCARARARASARARARVCARTGVRAVAKTIGASLRCLQAVPFSIAYDPCTHAHTPSVHVLPLSARAQSACVSHASDRRPTARERA